MRVPTNREPIHPGIMLREESLEPMGISQQKLADDISVPYQWVNEIVNKRRDVTPSAASRLGCYFGMSAQYWLNCQMCWDLYMTAQKEKAILETISVYTEMAAD